MLTSPEVLSGVVAAGLYAGTLGADFCYDDSRAIKSNQDLRPDVPWTHVFFDDFWGTPLTHSGSHKSFRPLCTLSFRLNYALGGLEPWGYHLVNVGLHAACSTAYTRLTGKLLPGKAWSFLAGLLFAVHPIHTEAVAGVVGRADVGAGLFFLLSLLSYVRYCQSRDGGLAMDEADCGQGRGKRWAWLSGSLVCAAASMLWKEQGVTVLMVAAVYDIFVHSGLTIADLLLLLCKARWSCILSMSKFQNSVRRARWVKGRGSLGSEFE